jgi:hypothetical protein
MLSFVFLSSLALLAGPSLAQNTTGTTPLCAQASILAQGIALNIVDQQNELAMANLMATMLKSNPVNMQQYSTARENLLLFITNGIAIRQMNQQVIPRGNGAVNGLAVVRLSPVAELVTFEMTC